MSNDAMNYRTGNVKAVKREVGESIDAIAQAYKELQDVAAATGMGGDQGQKLNTILSDVSESVTQLQRKVESMGEGVEVKETQDKVSQREADNVWHM